MKFRAVGLLLIVTIVSAAAFFWQGYDGSSTASGSEPTTAGEYLTGDLAHVAAAAPARASQLPRIDASRTIHVFTKAADGFDLDVVPSSDSTVCFVVLNAQTQLGTNHASTCGTPAQVADRPMLAIIADDGSGELAGIMPADSTSGYFLLNGERLPVTVKKGYWAVALQANPAMNAASTNDAVAHGSLVATS